MSESTLTDEQRKTIKDVASHTTEMAMGILEHPRPLSALVIFCQQMTAAAREEKDLETKIKIYSRSMLVCGIVAGAMQRAMNSLPKNTRSILSVAAYLDVESFNQNIQDNNGEYRHEEQRQWKG